MARDQHLVMVCTCMVLKQCHCFNTFRKIEAVDTEIVYRMMGMVHTRICLLCGSNLQHWRLEVDHRPARLALCFFKIDFFLAVWPSRGGLAALPLHLPPFSIEANKSA